MLTKITTVIAQNGGWLASMIWIIGLALVSPMIANSSGLVMIAAYAAVACAAIPAVVGLGLAGRMDEEFSRFSLTLMWTALAAAIAAASGGVTGAAAFAFLLPVAAAASGGTRRAVIEASALAGITAVMIGGLQFGGFLPALPGAFPVFQHAVPVATLFIAFGLGAGAIRALASHDQYKANAQEFEVRSAAFDASPAAIAACRDGEIIAASNGLRKLSPGLPPRLDGLSFADLGFDEADRQALTQITMGGEKSTSLKTAIRSSSGVRADTDVQLANFDGGWVAAFTPVSSDGQLTHERDVAVSETRAKTEFLASISHEIRTPLNAIIGFSDVMKSRLFGPMPARYAEYAELIHESGRHLLDLIGDVLDISKIEADRYELSKSIFDARDVVDICSKLLQQRATESGVDLKTDLPEDSLPVEADRKALRQILLNLLSNAVKFTPSGGAVIAMARREDGDLIIAVGDSGVGIPNSEIEALGQPYKQASTAHNTSERGTGLGLSLVRSLAGLHGGVMTIDSEVGEGTTVTVRLPVMTQGTHSIGSDDDLEVHDRIRRAQAAGGTIASATRTG